MSREFSICSRFHPCSSRARVYGFRAATAEVYDVYWPARLIYREQFLKDEPRVWRETEYCRRRGRDFLAGLPPVHVQTFFYEVIFLQELYSLTSVFNFKSAEDYFIDKIKNSLFSIL